MRYISLNVIYNNLKLISKNDYLVLKSDAYGFGLKKILKLVKKTKHNKICVINVDDAKIVRKKLKKAKILLTTPLNESLLKKYKKLKLELSITKQSDLDFVLKHNFKYQVKLNTGMNRFGVKKLENFESKNLTGLYSHNATSDYFHINNQLEILSSYNTIKEKHYFSSKEFIHKSYTRRIGQKIYEDSLTIKANVISYNHLKKGDYVGYDYSYQAVDDCIVGVLDIGYADGLERNCSGFLVYSNNNFYKLVGKSCMNNSFVILPSEDINEVEFISNSNPIKNYMKYFNLIEHEIFIKFSLSKTKYIKQKKG